MSARPGANLLKYQSRTLSDLLNEHLKSPRLKGYFSMLCAGIGAAPGRLSAVIAGIFFIHALRTMWMPRGGFGKLAEALAEMFQEQGGTLLTGCEAARILMNDGQRQRDRVRRRPPLLRRHRRLGQRRAPHVPADARPAGTCRPTCAQQLPRTPLTPSIFQVHLGVDMDLEPYREQIKRLNFIYPYDDIDRAMGNFPSGNVEEAAFFLYVATFHQPEMAPPGKHSLKLEAYTTLNSTGIDWERDQQKIGDVFIRRAEQLIPHLGEHIVTRVHRTPLDLQRDTGNADGAFAGWSFAPEQLSRGRPFQRTPVPGLYLAGHWTTPSAGVPWVMLSGYNTASMVLGDRARGRRQPRSGGTR